MKTLMTMSQWNSFLRPCVYLFWKNDECIYVGRSENGLLRPLNKTHPVNKQDDIVPDHLEFHWCESREESIYLEKLLLWEFAPILNSPQLIAELEDNKWFWMKEEDRVKYS
jgi:hypothetical protein